MPYVRPSTHSRMCALGVCRSFDFGPCLANTTSNIVIIIGAAAGGAVILMAIVAYTIWRSKKAKKLKGSSASSGSTGTAVQGVPMQAQRQAAQPEAVQLQVAVNVSNVPMGAKFDPNTGAPIPQFDPNTGAPVPKFDPNTGMQNF